MSDGGDKTCFVIMPITVPAHFEQRYGGREDHFTKIYDALIEPAVRAAGLEPIPPSRSGTENIQAAIINDLQGADLVLADLSALNPNVFLELGIRSALDKPVCLVSDGLDVLPFDSRTLYTHTYDPKPVYELNAEIARMAAHITATVTKSDGRNELWKFFGSAAKLPTAELEPEDATVLSRLDRLTELVENRLAPRQAIQGRDLVPPELAVKLLVSKALVDAGANGVHGTAVADICKSVLGDDYAAFLDGSTLSGRLRQLGISIDTNSSGYFFLGSPARTTYDAAQDHE